MEFNIFKFVTALISENIETKKSNFLHIMLKEVWSKIQNKLMRGGGGYDTIASEGIVCYARLKIRLRYPTELQTDRAKTVSSVYKTFFDGRLIRVWYGKVFGMNFWFRNNILKLEFQNQTNNSQIFKWILHLYALKYLAYIVFFRLEVFHARLC